MKIPRKLTRRSFMARVVGGAVAGGGAASLVIAPAFAQNVRYTGVTDCDTGNGGDRPGHGTGVRNQYTDTDTGPNGDPRCRGRGPAARSEGSPSGQGNYGYTQGATGCSDADRSPNADPGGRGQRCNGGTPVPRYPPGRTRHCTDSDRGGGADPLGGGRRC